MSKTKSFSYGVTNLRFSFVEFVRNNRIKIYVCGFFLLVGLLTGIFTAIKNSTNENLKFVTPYEKLFVFDI